MDNLFDPERRELAREYHNKKDHYRWFDRIITIIFWIFFIGFSLEYKLYNLVTRWVKGKELRLIVYIVLFYLIYNLIDLVLNYFWSYKLNIEFDLSTQSVKEWLLDQFKVFLLNLLLFYSVARLFIYLVGKISQFWFIPLTIIGFLFILIIQFIFPVILLPLFFQLTPYPEGELKKRLQSLFQRAGMNVEEIYEINLSSKMNAANAAVMGMGSTRKIVLGDTLIDKFTNEEIEAIMAHEIGHHLNKDILKDLLFQPLILFFVTYIIYLIWPEITNIMGYPAQSSIMGLPLLFLLSQMINWLITPLYLKLKKKSEIKADVFAGQLTGNPENMAQALAKIADSNLAKLYYSKYEKIFEASHPSIGKRIETVRDNNSK